MHPRPPPGAEQHPAQHGHGGHHEDDVPVVVDAGARHDGRDEGVVRQDQQQHGQRRQPRERPKRARSIRRNARAAPPPCAPTPQPRCQRGSTDQPDPGPQEHDARGTKRFRPGLRPGELNPGDAPVHGEEHGVPGQPDPGQKGQRHHGQTRDGAPIAAPQCLQPVAREQDRRKEDQVVVPVTGQHEHRDLAPARQWRRCQPPVPAQEPPAAQHPGQQRAGAVDPRFLRVLHEHGVERAQQQRPAEHRALGTVRGAGPAPPQPRQQQTARQRAGEPRRKLVQPQHGDRRLVQQLEQRRALVGALGRQKRLPQRHIQDTQPLEHGLPVVRNEGVVVRNGDGKQLVRPQALGAQVMQPQPATQQDQQHHDRQQEPAAARARLHHHLPRRPDQSAGTAPTVSASAITPPPRQTSPSYSTALWPGVTAHCGSVKARRQLPGAGPGSSVQAASCWR